MKEEDLKTIKSLFDNDLTIKTDTIWMLSMLFLTLFNKEDSEKLIVNIYLGDE